MLFSFLEYPIEMNEQKKADLLLHLKKGGVLFTPTDTVFGVLSFNKNHIYEIKERPTGFLLQLLGTEQMIKNVFDKTITSNIAFQLITQHFWPGSLSIIAKSLSGNTECLRVPNNLFLLDLLRRLGKPLFASSLNLHGQPELRSADEIKALAVRSKHDISVVFQETQIRAASTIIDFTCNSDENASFKIIRNGDLPISEIISMLSQKFSITPPDENSDYYQLKIKGLR
jgi:L-threonylcarbamoyladenylate synthase